MRRVLVALGAAIAFGAVLVAAFGWGSLWLYVFGLGFVALLAFALRQGGDVVKEWSRRRFDDRR